MDRGDRTWWFSFTKYVSEYHTQSRNIFKNIVNHTVSELGTCFRIQSLSKTLRVDAVHASIATSLY